MPYHPVRVQCLKFTLPSAGVYAPSSLPRPFKAGTIREEKSPVFIVDAHEDIASNVLHHGRDVRRGVAETRALESAARAEQAEQGAEGQPHRYRPETAMIGIPDMRRGGVGLVFATIFVMPGETETMVTDGLAQIRYYNDLAQSTPGVRIITDRARWTHSSPTIRPRRRPTSAPSVLRC